MHLAAKWADLESVKALLNHKADVDIVNGNGSTPLDYLYDSVSGFFPPYPKFIKLIDDFLTDGFERNAAAWTAVLHHRLEVASFLISHGAHLGNQMKSPVTPAQVRTLRSRGVNVDERIGSDSPFGQQLLQYSDQQDKPDCAQETPGGSHSQNTT